MHVCCVWDLVWFCSVICHLDTSTGCISTGVASQRNSCDNYIITRNHSYRYVINTTTPSVPNRTIRRSACTCLFWDFWVIYFEILPDVMLLLFQCITSCLCWMAPKQQQHNIWLTPTYNLRHTYRISLKWVHASNFKYFIMSCHGTTLKKWHFDTK